MLGNNRGELRILLINCGSKRNVSCVHVIEQLIRTVGFEELHDGPNGDVLEGCVGTGQKSVQILVHTTIRFIPDVIESGVVIG